jgi:hypothetical protein
MNGEFMTLHDQANIEEEEHLFEVHVNLLRDVIGRQTGEPSKGLSEGVMNAIEAFATRVEITATPTRIQIKDDGKGFETYEEVMEAFKCFGKSDERKESGRYKAWAQFQMGRGQLLTLGKTRYRTRTFAMDVDMSQPGSPKFRLTRGLEDQPGCIVTVDLFDPFNVFQLAELGKQVTRNVKYVDVPISFNGKVINPNSPRLQKWSHENENAYYEFRGATDHLSVYNLGIYVGQVYDTGIGGTVVSKKQIKLNFARNEVIRDCPVWKAIRSEFKQKTAKSLLDKKAFSARDASTVLDMIRNGEILYWQAAGLRILRDTNNKPRSFRDVERKKVAFDKRGSIKADRAMQLDPFSVILDVEYMQVVLNADDGELDRLFIEAARYAQHNPHDATSLPTVVPVESLYVEIKGDQTVLDEAKLDKVYRSALEALRSSASQAKFHYSREPAYSQHAFSERHIKLGKSDSKATWTDGRTYIVLSFESFKSAIWTVSGWTDLMLELAGMYAFTTDDWTRDFEYYERFHDYARSFVLMGGRAFRNFTRLVVERHPERASRLRTEAIAMAALEGEGFENEDVAADDVTDGLGEAPDESDRPPAA